MPTLPSVICGVNLPAPSKYLGSFSHTIPGCNRVSAESVMDFACQGWSGENDGLEVHLNYSGENAGTQPKWKRGYSFGTCGSIEQLIAISCLPNPADVNFILPFSCCNNSAVHGNLGTHPGVVYSSGKPQNPVKPAECPPCEPCCNLLPPLASLPSAPSVSSAPVCYATGEVILQSTDLQTGGFGQPWGQKRSFASRQSTNETMGGGYNWQSAHAPFLTIKRSNGVSDLGTPLKVYSQGGGGATAAGFKQSSGGGYVGLFEGGPQLNFAPAKIR